MRESSKKLGKHKRRRVALMLTPLVSLSHLKMWVTSIPSNSCAQHFITQAEGRQESRSECSGSGCGSLSWLLSRQKRKGIPRRNRNQRLENRIDW